MKYIKLFQNNAAYQAYADSAEYIEPHVSLAVQKDELHYNKPQKWIATYQDGHTESAWCDGTSEIVENEITKENLVSIEIGDCVTRIGDWAFSGCTSLSMVNIPDSVTSIGGGGAFEDCESLTSIRIPNSVTDIGNFCFNGCTSLTSVNIHNSVTQIKKFTFHNCISLASVIIPSSVTYIGDSAFQECENLTSITIEATTPPYLGELAFEGSTCPIYVPAESVDAYKAASGWSDYADRIQPIV